MNKLTLNEPTVSWRSVQESQIPVNVFQSPNIKTFESRLDQHWKEYEGKYNFRSTYSPTANQRSEHEETIEEEGAVEEPEI